MAKKINADALKSIMNDSEVKENGTSSKTTQSKAVGNIKRKRLGNINITLSLNTIHYNQLMDYLEESGVGVTPYLRSLLYEKGVISDDFDE